MSARPLSVRPPTVRPLALAAVAALAAAPVPAVAAPGPAPGEGGDVRIHQVGTPFDDARTEPSVCAFYLVAAGFGVLDAVSWKIAPQPHETDGHSVAGRISLAGGSGQTSRLALPDGAYRLGWAREGAEGVGTHKAFTVSCPGAGRGGDAKNGNAAPPHARAAAAPAPAGEVPTRRVTAAEDLADEDSTVFGIGSGIAALLAGGAGFVLAHRTRHRDDEPA
ncbi:hypothetical protein [Streptomyces sp.]|uniref:hypothetical protein n=1 Tax=Streptomyces sp. TaxID=1931 RepID=UPI002F95C030